MTAVPGKLDAVWYWGSTAEERAASFECDRFIAGPVQTLFRAVDVDAPAAVTYRWLCQLRAAPYSYDWLDNLGRRSPQGLTPGLEQLAVGQRIQTTFRIVAFSSGVSITMATRPGLLGAAACTYRVEPVTATRSRIIVKVVVAPPPGRLRGALFRFLLPPGDLVMMRRQLLNLRRLAERTARGSG